MFRFVVKILSLRKICSDEQFNNLEQSFIIIILFVGVYLCILEMLLACDVVVICLLLVK